ncbi:4'-phosphopantetheinyl transferase family protein [Massilia sp. PWRC2]|uniref:4'-phosphopantetheinyl transferase family protein n=1 Tax=Massilia sp. PWRC2 TaxID=2804626 RepID=UPI003CF69B72
MRRTGSASPVKTLVPLAWPPADAAGVAWEGDLLAISTVATGGDRAAARGAIRAAVGAATALLTGVGAERIEVAGAAGSAPHLLIDGGAAAIGVSISHCATLSVAVLHRAGAVGVDVMQIGIGNDWARVAWDYLGPATASLLAASLDATRPLAFCRAWTRREAALKLRGEQLREWCAADAADRSHLVELLLGDGLTGVAAVATA